MTLGWTAAILLTAGAAWLPAARSQEPEPLPPDLEPITRPVTVFLLEKPTVTVSLAGDYGPVRLTGVLDAAPAEPLRVTSSDGVQRDAAWSELRTLGMVRLPAEGFPTGSYRVGLVSDPVTYAPPAGAGLSRSYGEGGTWRGGSLPEGKIRLRGAPYGTLEVPVSRLTALQMEPIRGSVASFPAGALKLQILEGAEVSLPLPLVQSYRRDMVRGIVTVVLEDDQTFTGRLVELPKVAIAFSGEPKLPAIPLEAIAALERTPPGGRRL